MITALMIMLRIASAVGTIVYVKRLRRRVFLLERLAGGAGR